MPNLSPEVHEALNGLTADQALAVLERDLPPIERLDGPGAPSRYELEIELPTSAPRRPGLLRRLAARVCQAFCDHAAATSHKIPGAIPRAYERRCSRCGAHWSWREET